MLQKPLQKATACDNCYAAKRKCDGQVPRCSLCKKQKAECTYVRRYISPALIRRPRKEQNEEINTKIARKLEKRLHEVEETVKTLFKDIATPYATPLAGIPSSSGSVPSPSGSSLGLSLSSYSTPSLPNTTPAVRSRATSSSSASSSTVSPPMGIFSAEDLLLDFVFPSSSTRFAMDENGRSIADFDKRWIDTIEDAFEFSNNVGVLDEVEDPMDAVMADAGAPTDPAFNMSDEEMDGLLKTFFEIARCDSIYIIPLPIVHEATFLLNLRSFDTPPSRCLTYSMCALAAISGPSRDGSYWPYHSFSTPDRLARSDEILGAAIAHLNVEKPSVEICQALVMMMWCCAVMDSLRVSQEWLLGGMAMRMLQLIKLDVDPDELEMQDPSGRRWTWLEKETRRRVFALLRCVDQVDFIFRELSFNLWKRPAKVKPPCAYALWFSVDPRTGEPTLPIPSAIVPSPAKPLDTGLMCLWIIDVICSAMEFTMATGVVMGTTINTSTEAPESGNFANPLAPSTWSAMSGLGGGTVGVPGGAGGVGGIGDAEARFRHLELELLSWEASLPAEISAAAVFGSDVFRMRYDAPGPDLESGPPLYQGIRLHLWYQGAMLGMHRSRVMRALKGLGVTMAIGSAAGGLAEEEVLVKGFEELGVRGREEEAGRESLKRSFEASSKITGILRKRIRIVSPSFLMTDGDVAIGSVCAVNESRAVLEAGLFWLVAVVLAGKSGMEGGKMPPRVRLLVEEVLTKEIVAQARMGLAVTMEVLKSIARRRPRVRVMHEMLARLVDAAGIDKLEPVSI